MRMRAVAILVENERVALIERHRAGRHYFSFPGGGAEAGEALEQAVLREMLEETGLRVTVERKVAEIPYQGNRQVYRPRYYIFPGAAPGRRVRDRQQ